MEFGKMQIKSVPAIGNADGPNTETHHDTYRILCLLTAVLNPAFGIVYHYTDPSAIDPLWARLLLSVPFLGLFVFSYVSGWVRRHLIRLVHGFFYLLPPFYAGLTAINNYAPNYTIGLLFVLTATGVAVSLGARRSGPLIRYLAYGALVTVLGIFLVEEPEVSYSLLSISSFSTVFVIYVVANSKLRAEDVMQQTAHRYQTLMNSANDAIFIADYDADLLVNANEKALELTGRSLDEIRRMRPYELFPEEQRETCKAILYDHALNGTPIAIDLYVEHRNGETIPVEVSASVIEVDGRKLIQGIFRDVTERHRYEAHLVEAKEQAEELLQLKTSLLNNMSHELRTPLAGILGYAELLTSQGDEKHRTYAERIALSAKRLQQTLNSVLDLAELESGRTMLERKEVDLVSEVRQVVKLHEQLAYDKSLELRVVAHPESIPARIDPVCLNRVLTNLISNAVKFTNEGYVKVVVEGSESEVEICVTDTGVGIQPNFLPHVFDEFRQESSGLSRSHEGNGLGLAITKRLVELMDGRIEVRSEKNFGSTFRVILPRKLSEDDDAPESQAKVPLIDVKRAEGKRVLIVEDDPYMRELMEQQLNDPYRTVATASPDAALRAAKSEPFDVLLLDINLGRKQSGIDVLRKIRLASQNTNTPAIAVTAYAMPGDRDYFLSAGFDAYIGKPFSRNQLLNIIAEALDAREKGLIEGSLGKS